MIAHDLLHRTTAISNATGGVVSAAMALSNTSAFGTNTSAPRLANCTSQFNGSASTSLSNLETFGYMAGLAAYNVLQPSGADEFSSTTETFSPARVSPLICAADVLIAVATICYGMFKGLTFGQACVLHIRNTCRTRKDIPQLTSIATLIKALLFYFPVSAILKIYAARGLNARILVWTTMYFISPIVHAFIRLVTENVRAQEFDPKDRVNDEDTRKLLLCSDTLWCCAYILQFMLWVQVFQGVINSPELSGPQHRVATNVTLGLLIAVAITLSFCCRTRLYRYWSLGNWDRDEWTKSGTAAFVIGLPLGLPDDSTAIMKWRHTVFIPLAAFGIVVIMLWFVTVLRDTIDYVLIAVRAGAWFPFLADDTRTSADDEEEEEDSDRSPKELRTRLNPLLSTAPTRWRRTLMVNFALCQVIFAALNFALLYDDQMATLPSWTGVLGG